MLNRCIHIVLEGILDSSCKECNGKTPLQTARTPVLDFLAAHGLNTLYHGTSLGEILSPELTQFLMLGYQMKDYPGAACLEALGTGIPLGASDVALSGVFASIKQTGKTLLLIHDEPQLSANDADTLTEAISSYSWEDVKISFHRTKNSGGIIIMKGNVTPWITDTQPLKIGDYLIDIEPWADYASDHTTINTARALKSYIFWAHEELKKHPINKERTGNGLPSVNFILTSQSGQLTQAPRLIKYNGLAGAVISSSNIMLGMGKHTHMEMHASKEDNNPSLDIENKVKAALHIAGDFNYIHIHIKPPFETMGRSPLEKRKVIEQIDHGLRKSLAPLLTLPGILLVVSALYPNGLRRINGHSGEAVPIVFLGKGIPSDEVSNFDEISSGKGAPGLIRGRELPNMILDFLNLAKPVEIFDSPAHNVFRNLTPRPLIIG